MPVIATLISFSVSKSKLCPSFTELAVLTEAVVVDREGDGIVVGVGRVDGEPCVASGQVIALRQDQVWTPTVTVGASFTSVTATATVLLSLRPPLSVPVMVRLMLAWLSKSLSPSLTRRSHRPLRSGHR